MKLDFTMIEDVESFVSVPEGTYDCKVSEVRLGITRDGSPRWAMRLEVTDGEYAGRTAAWDALVFSERGLPRVKLVLQCFGLDVTGTLEIEPNDLVGLHARAQCMVEDYEDRLTGRRLTRLRVPYMGYEQTNGNGNGNPH